MKILHLDDRFTRQGGVGQYILSLAELLERHGHESLVAYRDAATCPGSSVPAHVLPQDPVGARAALTALVARERPDVAMVHHVSSPELIHTVTQLLPAVAYVHGFVAVCPGLAKYHRRGDRVCEHAFDWRCFPTNYLRRCSSARKPLTMLRLMRHTAELKAAYAEVGHLVVGSEYMRGLLVQNGFRRDAISVLAPHFVDPADIPPYAPPEEPKTVLYAGRLEIEKGLPYLIRAMALLPASVELIVAGDGTQRSPLEALVSGLDLQDRIQFLGWQSDHDLKALYRRCSMLVVPSVCPEPFGKVGIEAMTHGRPVVAFDVGGIGEWLAGRVTGRLVTPRDISGLAQAIGELVAVPVLCERMGRNGQRYVQETLGAETHLGQVIAVLRHTMTSGARNAGGETK